jgi:cellulose synthase/poly-beta-1,6-N-acetylglucosamine synthase-like glycosyltransferase
MSLPFVSVLVPVRNEERNIQACLARFASQDYPRDRFEVIVVDGDSDDATAELVRRFASDTLVNVQLLHNPKRWPASALNIGLGVARGELIVRVDGHAFVDSDFLLRSVEASQKTGGECVGGAIRSRGDGFFGRIIAVAMASRFGVGGANFRTGQRSGPVDTVAFGTYKRSVFERIGIFAEDLTKGEDCELNYRLLDDGGRILLIPAIHSSYLVRGTIGGLWRQYFSYGRSKPEIIRRHPRQARPRHLMPAMFFSALAAGAIIAAAGFVWPLVLVAGAYAAFLLTGAIKLSLLHRAPQLMLIPLAFAAMHVSYGIGFFVGLVELPFRKREALRPYAPVAVAERRDPQSPMRAAAAATVAEGAVAREAQLAGADTRRSDRAS